MYSKSRLYYCKNYRGPRFFGREPLICRAELALYNKHKVSFPSHLNSSTIDELGEGAWKDSGASSTRAERVG